MALPAGGGPEIAAVVMVLGLVATSRWVFKPSRPNRRVERVDATDARELGLLHVVSTVGRADAAEYRKRLADNGIRASTSLRKDGRYDLLVFSRDLDRARELLAQSS